MINDSWSYSALSDYEACAFLYKGKYIDHIRAPKVPAMERGIEYHKAAEAAVTQGTVPEILTHFANELSRLHTIKAEGNQDKLKLAFDRKWRRVPWAEGWVKMIPDTVAFENVTATVIEYKTGKEYEGHVEQTELYALGVFHAASKVQRVEREAWYFDGNYIQPHPTLLLAELPSLQLEEAWSERANRMLTDKHFEPTPSWRCKRCHLNSDNGGPCTAGAQI